MIDEIYKVEPGLIEDIDYIKLHDVENRGFTFIIHFFYITKFGEINRSEISLFKFMEHYKNKQIKVISNADMQRILLRKYGDG